MDINNPLIHNIANIGGSFLKPRTDIDKYIRRKYGFWFCVIVITLLFSYYGLQLILSADESSSNNSSRSSNNSSRSSNNSSRSSNHSSRNLLK